MDVRRFSLYLATLAFLGGLAGPLQAQEDPGLKGISPALLEAAKKEGQLTLYATSQSDAVNALVDGFKKAVPEIDVSVLRLATDPMIVRFMSENDAGVHQADVLNVYSSSIFEEHKDMWTPLSPAAVPSLAAWPADQVKDVLRQCRPDDARPGRKQEPGGG